MKRFGNAISKLVTEHITALSKVKVKFWRDALWKTKLKLIYFLQHLINEIAYLYIHYGENMLVLTLR